MNRQKNKAEREEVCDSCGRERKVTIKRNYPFGKKSKPIISKICSSCKLKETNLQEWVNQEKKFKESLKQMDKII